MKKLYVGAALLFFVFFLSSCAINHQAKTQPSIREASEAEYNLGEKYFNGEGVSKNYKKAAECYRKAAEQGNARAQAKLGYMYQKGKGLPQDRTKATKWYRKAAEQGHAEAQFSLGDVYHFGLGGIIPKDYTKASEWYRKAAEQGNVLAQNSLGNMYVLGNGVPINYKEAAKWRRKAAEQGDNEGQFFLGMMYDEGEGVPKDYTKAVEWYQKASNQGNAYAQYHLGSMYFYGKGVPKDYTKAFKWYSKAAEKEIVDAQSALGFMCYFGQSVPQDYKKAAEWLLKAAEQGNARAQAKLGYMYQVGQGIPQDRTKAFKWTSKAAEQGEFLARLSLPILLKEMYLGWECLNIGDTDYVYINKNKIRRQNDLVWFWTMVVTSEGLLSGGKGTKRNYRIADCNSGMSGLVSYIDYDFNGKIIDLHTFKKSEIDMIPVAPGSIGERLLEYACSHAKAEVRKKEEAAKTGPCSGTGWPVASGFVVTNNHVVEGRNHITLIRQDGVKIPATVAAHDAFNDLALLEVEDTGLLPAALPLSSKAAALGEKIVTVGYPHPDLLGVKPKLTEGVVNSTSGLGDDPRALQISVPIQAGNSGGPLVNMEGKVVGIVTSKVNAVKMFKWTGDLPQNINYGIKISYLQGLLSSVSPKKRIDTIRPFNYTSVKELAKKIKSSVLIIVAK